MTGVITSQMQRGTLVITLNRPGVLNAVNRELREAVTHRLGEANALATLVFLFNIGLIACNLALFKQRRSP